MTTSHDSATASNARSALGAECGERVDRRRDHVVHHKREPFAHEVRRHRPAHVADPMNPTVVIPAPACGWGVESTWSGS